MSPDLPARPDLRLLAERFLERIRLERFGAAQRLSREHPAIVDQGIHAAAGAADRTAVHRWLARDPALANAADGRYRWTPLGYACWSRAFEASERAAQDNLEIVRALIDAGADPNLPVYSQDPEPARLPVLYLACHSHQTAIVRLLLERGALPNDGESTYHAAQDGHIDCLELLLAHGADPSNAHSQWGNTPLYFLAGHADDARGQAPWIRGFRWLLDHGADPNVTSHKTAETPLHQVARIGTSTAAAALLLEHGANPLAGRADRKTPYQLAVRSGSTALVRLLEQHMTAVPDLSTTDQFINACLTANEPVARTILAAHPDLVAALTTEDYGVIQRAAANGLSAALRLMASLGFDLARESSDGGTPLHWAAWHGRVDAVRQLLELGAPIDVRDRTYGSSPVAWAAHGSRFCRKSDDEYVAIVEMLLDRDPDYTASVNRWNEPPNEMGSPAVTALFRRRGFGGPQAAASSGNGGDDDSDDD